MDMNNTLIIISNLLMAIATCIIAAYSIISYVVQRRRDREINEIISSIKQTQTMDKEKNNLDYFQKYQDQHVELIKYQKELETFKHETRENDRIRKEISSNDPVNVWLNKVIRNNPDYILSANKKEIEVLVKNTFAEEESQAFINNAKNAGLVDDKLNLTTRGFNTLVKAAKTLSTNVLR